jgi:hypothetical protein
MLTDNRSTPIRKIVLTTLAEKAKAPSVVFKEAEAAAKAQRHAKTPDPDPYRFAINYRLNTKTPSAKGDYDTRYKALVELVKVLGPRPWHYATSSWEIHSHQTKAAVLAALSAPLDVKIDVLTVTPISVSVVFGDPSKL